MKILNITKYFYPKFGGIESRIIEVSKYFVSKGNKVFVVTSNSEKSKKKEIYNGVVISRNKILFTFLNDPFCLGEILDILRLKYDIVHVDLPDPVNSITAFFASKIKHKHLFVTYHADIEKKELNKFPLNIFLKVYNFILKKILNHAKIIFATSPNYVEESKILRNFKNKVKITPNFVDISKFSSNEIKVQEIKRKHGLKNEKVVLFAGRLVEYKGVKYLIEAFKEVEKEIDARLIIVGDGPLKDSLKKISDEKIIFAGKVDDLLPYYHLCDIFVLPSITRQEAFGMVLVEAMACSKPCITTNISGMPYVIGDSGILVEPKNVKQLKDAIIKLLRDDGLRENLGLKARKRVQNKFTSEVVLPEIYKVFVNSIHSKF